MANPVNPPQARIQIGTATMGGAIVPVMIDQEWMRFFSLQANALNGGLAGFTGAQGQAGAAVALSSDEGGEVEFIPGPPGPKGDRGEPGPALWMLEDPQETEVFWKV
jgi:hypothetical protein